MHLLVKWWGSELFWRHLYVNLKALLFHLMSFINILVQRSLLWQQRVFVYVVLFILYFTFLLNDGKSRCFCCGIWFRVCSSVRFLVLQKLGVISFFVMCSMISELHMEFTEIRKWFVHCTFATFIIKSCRLIKRHSFEKDKLCELGLFDCKSCVSCNL